MRGRATEGGGEVSRWEQSKLSWCNRPNAFDAKEENR